MTAISLDTIKHNEDGTITEGTITVDPDTAVKHTKPQPTTISASDFFNRFTPDEHNAVWQLATADTQIGVGLMQGLAAGRIDLASDALKTWMDGLVLGGAITSERETAILVG